MEGFTFMFDLQWVYGNKLICLLFGLLGNRVTFSMLMRTFGERLDAGKPKPDSACNAFREDGYENDVDSWSCEPGSFLRLRNIGLKYDFSSRNSSAAHQEEFIGKFNVENAFLDYELFW